MPVERTPSTTYKHFRIRIYVLPLLFIYFSFTTLQGHFERDARHDKLN